MKQLSDSEKRRGFRIHAVVFALTMLLLIVINVATGPPYWALWVLPGWSIGLLSHWCVVPGAGARPASTVAHERTMR